MTPAIHNFYRTQRLTITFLIIASAIIWFGGPFIAIAGYIPLQLPEKRLYLILLLYLSWLLKILFVDTASEQNNEKNAAAAPEAAKKLQLLQERFNIIFNFLKKNTVNKNGEQISLSTLPWYLVIGPQGAGKTTLLANSTIKFILAKKFSPESILHIPPSETCDWWINRDTVLIDTPGTFLTPKTDDYDTQPQDAIPNILWHKLLGLIKSTCPKNQINGVIIALNLTELFKQPKQYKQCTYDLKKRIAELRAQFGPDLPFYLIITKCDVIPGFSAFFSESSNEELTQTWGISLPTTHNKEQLIDVFIQNYNTLVKRLNSQVIWRLHQERDPHLRPLIKDFPQYIEHLKENIISLLKAIFIANLHLHGIYLTSAVQPQVKKLTTYLQAVTDIPQQAIQLMHAPHISRPYFIRQLISHVLTNPMHHQNILSYQKNQTRKKLVYTLSASVVVAVVALLGFDFQKSLQKHYALKNNLAQYQKEILQSKEKNEHLLKTLALLDTLTQTMTTSSKPEKPIDHLVTVYSKQSQQTAETVYHQTIRAALFPEITKYLEGYLRAQINDPEKIYPALKAYLMLRSTKNLQTEFLISTLNTILPTPLDEKAQEALTKHLNTALNDNVLLPILDKNLIIESRKKLITLPSVNLALLILKNINNNDAKHEIALGTNLGNPPIFVSENHDNIIPKMFSAHEFQNILTNEISLASAEALRGNWILGEIAPNPEQPSLAGLMTQLQHKYITRYVEIWEELINNVKPYTPNSLEQADTMITTLTSNNSPLLQLLKTIKHNTAFTTINTASPKIQALNNLLTNAHNNKENSLYQVFIRLQQLHLYLHAILTSPDINQAAAAAVAARLKSPTKDPITQIEQIADENPEPIRTWLHTLARQSWDFLAKSLDQNNEKTSV